MIKLPYEIKVGGCIAFISLFRRIPRFTITLAGLVMLCGVSSAQVNTGSDGHDGAFNPTANIVINMASHPDGIYQYTSVNIPTNVTVTFIPNVKNTPVVWLVQGSVVIKGVVDVSGMNGTQGNGSSFGGLGGLGGPGGYRGGSGGASVTSGQGPGMGSGSGANNSGGFGANASYGSLGNLISGNCPPGSTYGNSFLVPLLGGSGGGGATVYGGQGGGGGGGAILVAASEAISMIGTIMANGGKGVSQGSPSGGGGSGGAVRLIASLISGSGVISASGGTGPDTPPVSGSWWYAGYGGSGRVRFDTFENSFSGGISGVFSQGFQPVIIPSAGQLPQLTVTSVAGVPVSASPTGTLSTPDAVVSAQQGNPIPIVVQCANLALNTPITVSIKAMNGSAVSAIGYNNSGTLAASTATVTVNLPRGGGLIYAIAATAK